MNRRDFIWPKIPTEAKCPTCEMPLSHTGTSSTLLGYESSPGHKHDDNCRKRTYTCDNGHAFLVSRRNSCPACDWKGKEECFCHPGAKVDKWPEEQDIS